MRTKHLSRAISVALAVTSLAGLAAARTASAAPSCTPRLLVLSAYPGEIEHNLSSAKIQRTVLVEHRPFYVGRLRGNNVVLALTGIGLVNAETTTKIALAHFRCISGIVFSGVAGGKTFIGDVIVPTRWTIDNGKSFFKVDSAMFATARKMRVPKLAQDTPAGDAACAGTDPRAVMTPVHLEHVPQVVFGGKGKSTDPFGGRAFTCVPCGGDVFGCEPCRVQKELRASFARFASTAPAFADPDFFLSYFEEPTPATTGWDSEDMETAAVGRVAARHKLPFIAFRAVSDGKGDPLNLPGFPAQFFFYRQLAADNAGTVAQAFLEAWARRG